MSDLENEPVIHLVEKSTIAEIPLASQAGLTILNDRLKHLSVSPPRRRDRDQSPSMWRASTPPPPIPAVVRSNLSTPQQPQYYQNSCSSSEGGGIARNHSSPCLMDASPKPRSHRRKSPPATTAAGVMHSPAVRHAQRAHELTPVMRNTSNDSTKGPYADEGVVVSPDDAILHGEFLALPKHDADDFDDTNFYLSTLPRRSSGPSLPPLPMSERSKSLGILERRLARQQFIEGCYADYDYDDDDDDDDEVVEPIQFPSRKFYSFNSHQQYNQAVTHGPPRQAQVALKPYQPSRNDLGDMGTMSTEELSHIFHIQAPIPLDERQWSIPSIRMANHLNGSTTSYTDEEDDLFRGQYDDDASLSSRGSSLYLPDEMGSSEGLPRLGVSSSFPKPPPTLVMKDDLNNEGDDEDSDDPKARNKKRTRKNDKERQAYEWLRTVESGNDVIAEAASSKFLTGMTSVMRSYHRQESSPAQLERKTASSSPLPASSSS